ncbi:MAG TPA: sodium-dependent transporter [Motiliproteus sp.]
MSSSTATLSTPSATAAPRLWSSRFAFILAATGSAVGLGNIWKFPYITGENGGGAFVLVYLVCIALLGLPIMMAEVLIGRRGGHNPISSMGTLAKQAGANSAWQGLGWLGVIGSTIILSFYSVIGGWAVSYVGSSASGSFAGADADAIGALFGGLLGSPSTLLLWHSLFMLLVVVVVARGVRAGLEKATTWLMPALFVLLLMLVGYAALTDNFAQGVSFLFSVDFSKLSTAGVLTAMGHAFFTLSLGMGVMMAYGAYLPKGVSIARVSIAVSLMDTVVALLAGLAIFPIVFANGLEPGAGPGLIFQTLPLAFGQMPGGTLFGTLFFILLVFAAWSSAISLLEPVVAWLEEHKGISRLNSTLVAGLAIWALGILSILSLNDWADVHPLGMFSMFENKTIFDLLDFLTANIMLPLGGLLIALFVGWVMRREVVREELQMADSTSFRIWHFLLRFVTPVGVLVVFVYNLA